MRIASTKRIVTDGNNPGQRFYFGLVNNSAGVVTVYQGNPATGSNRIDIIPANSFHFFTTPIVCDAPTNLAGGASNIRVTNPGWGGDEAILYSSQ